MALGGDGRAEARRPDDMRRFRSLFPALTTYAWLNTANVAPGATPVTAAVSAAISAWASGAFSWQRWESDAEETRTLFGRLVEADPACVALLPSLGHAAAAVACCLPRGQIVVPEREFRSNLFPWLILRDRGFDVVTVAPHEGVVTSDRLASAITSSTVLVAVSNVQSSNGYRMQLAPVAARCREVGARLFVNATQSLGALRFDLTSIDADFVAAHGYKWMLAPRGAAWLYVRRDRLSELVPQIPTWKSVDDPYSELYGGPLLLSTTARKLDTSLAWFSWVGARAALELLLSFEMAQIEAACLGLAASFRQGAIERGWTPLPEDLPSHIVGLPTENAEQAINRLAAAGVIGSARDGYLRLGFHAFNTASDVDRALEALGRG